MKVVGIADSDSYVKWGASVLTRMPAAWSTSMTIIETPTNPSADQLADALEGTRFSPAQVAVRALDDLAAHVRREAPDVVLFSVRGPVVRVLVRAILAAYGARPRPLFVSGLPGISIPATRKALYYRAQMDFLLLHSKREIREFERLAALMGIEQQFGLASLPFLSRSGGGGRPDGDIVFAAQAKVPKPKEDRMLVLRWLSDTARQHPNRRVVVKLRAMAGEQQTHREKFPYEQLMVRLGDHPANLVFEAGPMADHLARAAALVTVSSTAAIEAAAMGVPVLALDDFGVDDDLINPVFEGSGLLGGSHCLLRGEFRSPREEWLDDNYFHGDLDETWVCGIEQLAELNRSGSLALRPQFRGSLGGGLRLVWDRRMALGHHDRSVAGLVALMVGTPARWIVLALRMFRPRARTRRPVAVRRDG